MNIIAAINAKPFHGVMLNATLHSPTSSNKPQAGTPLTEVPKATVEQPQLLITVPDSSIQLNALEVTLEAAASMECNEDFTLDKLSDKVVTMNFRKHLSNEGKF